MRPLLVLVGVMLALGMSSASAQAADKACGGVSAVFFGDLPSGGFVAIDGRRFQVGGVSPRNVVLPPATHLRVGVRACAVGDFRALADGAVDLYNGEVFVEATAGPLPNTSTTTADVGGAFAFGVLAAAGLAGAAKAFGSSRQHS